LRSGPYARRHHAAAHGIDDPAHTARPKVIVAHRPSQRHGPRGDRALTSAPIPIPIPPGGHAAAFNPLTMNSTPCACQRCTAL
jgi:hypothetical protein